MFAATSLLVILLLSLLVTRVASVALVHTGLGREAARFQARSAFSGAGYTTSEAEAVVGQPVRRRIVGWLMLAGNVGLVTAMSSLLVSVLGIEGSGDWQGMAVLAGGVATLWLVASSRWVDSILCRMISRALNRFTDIDARDYARLLHVGQDYGVTELAVREGDWLCGTLAESGLVQEGTLVLAIECPGGSFIGTPPADTPIRPGDKLILYGRMKCIAELDRRGSGPEGDGLHASAAQEYDEISWEERARAGR
jgi:hypothetical protein